MLRIRRLLFAAASLAVLTFASVSARADTVTIVGVDTGQFSTAFVNCTYTPNANPATGGTLTFTITNTSAVTQPGSTSTITAIGFDLPPIGNASPSGLNGFTGMQTGAVPPGTSSFTFSDADLGNVPHGFNTAVLDFGFITGSNFSGGTVSLGLLPGESASFTVSGAGFAGFTEEQICDAIFVRFQNVNFGQGSDVGVSTQQPIPEPTTMLLLGTGLAGIAAKVRRRRKASQAN